MEWQTRDWDEAPAHTVKISRPFHLGIHEVTNAQYERFDPAHKKWRGKDGVSAADEEDFVSCADGYVSGTSEALRSAAQVCHYTH